MINVGVINEATLNAIRAALDERIARLERNIRQAQEFASDAASRGETLTEDAQHNLVWNIDALLEAKTARDLFAALNDEPEQADPITAAKAYADLGYHDAQARYTR